MSIRSEAMPYRGELSYQLQDLLRRNGMRAQLAVQGDRYLLIVQGHDSPMLEYPISEQQFRALADGGTNYANKNAYKTFNNIVGKDFDMPSSYVAARNVNGRVAMGLHGYRERYLAGHRECRMVSISAEWPVSPWYPNTPMDDYVQANSKVEATATITKVSRKHRQCKTH